MPVGFLALDCLDERVDDRLNLRAIGRQERWCNPDAGAHGRDLPSCQIDDIHETGALELIGGGGCDAAAATLPANSELFTLSHSPAA